MKRKRGAPKGNQNARKHGFYSKVLDEAERLDFELATGVEGIDEEIALIRVKIKSLLERDPENKFAGNEVGYPTVYINVFDSIHQQTTP